MSICRVCLARNVQMHVVKDLSLLQTYEILANTPLNTEDSRPHTVCYLCLRQLQRCCAFSEVARRSDAMLRHTTTHAGLPVAAPALQSVSVLILSIECDLQSGDRVQWTERDTQYNYMCEYETTPTEHSLADHVKVEDISVTRDTDYHDFSDTDSDEPLINKIKDKKGPFSCPKCNKKYKQATNLKVHMNIHTKDKLFPCDLCGKRFLHNFYLKKHMKRHTTDDGRLVALDPRPFCCDRCSKKFKESTHLKEHLRTHTGEKPFECEVCKKRFNQLGNLTLHKKTHSGERAFACEQCGKTFLLKCHLKSHRRVHSHHRPHACAQCEMAFTLKCALKEHVRRLHSEVKPFACTKCGKSYDTAESLASHARAHDAERRFACELCNKRYTAGGFRRHTQEVHTSRAPHSCERCHKTFKLLKYLRQHKFVSTRCRARAMLPPQPPPPHSQPSGLPEQVNGFR